MGFYKCMLLIIVSAFLSVPCCGFPTTSLLLERRLPTNESISRLVERDGLRHGRMLSGVINYTLSGTADLSLGLYYTRVQLGTPARDFYVEFDTGSDITWVWCISCKDCPAWTGIANISVHRYSAYKSRSWSGILCDDKECPTPRETSEYCLKDKHNLCPYMVIYGDGTRSDGILSKDLLTYYSTDIYYNRVVKSTADIIFGCNYESNVQPNNQVDGVLGFNRHNLSVISQLASQGKSPRTFSHCLSGDVSGGGVLVFSAVDVPYIIYSRMIPSRHYVLDLKKMSVNGQVIQIGPSPIQPGARVDTGTALAYLPSQVFDSFLSIIEASTSAVRYPNSVDPCYLVTGRVRDAFPVVSLVFADNAEMGLSPEEYLLYQGVTNTSQVWCMGFQRNLLPEQPTVLGEILLRNKFIVYDLEGERIGWTDYDCSVPFNVTSSGNNTTKSWKSGQLEMLFFILWSLIIVVF